MENLENIIELVTPPPERGDIRERENMKAEYARCAFSADGQKRIVETE